MAILNHRVVPDSRPIYSQANFRRLEEDIKLIVRNYPSPTTFKPVSLSLTSYVVYIRGAMAAYPNSAWESDLPRDMVYKIRQEWEVQLDASLGVVTVGPRKSYHLQGAVADGVGLSSAEIIDAREPDVLHAACLLKNRNLIKGTIQVINLEADAAFQLCEQFQNIAIDRQPNNSAVII